MCVCVCVCSRSPVSGLDVRPPGRKRNGSVDAVLLCLPVPQQTGASQSRNDAVLGFSVIYPYGQTASESHVCSPED